ncbi:MAG: efflux RND transporter periplasmic adaptor subunit [Oleiphilaceae bacterium]|nr:efflux RND transporter periplasmic adaptor subunit [Oleiphilaceae bacterium]
MTDTRSPLCRCLALMTIALMFPWAQARESGVPVATDKAALAPVIQEVPLSGTVTSPQTSLISTSVAGLVERVHIEAGDRIKKGSVLVSLDPELVRHELSRIEAATRQARVSLADARRRLSEAQALENRRSIAESEVESRRTEVQAALANLAQRQAEQDLQSVLLDRHEISAPFDGAVARKVTAAGEWVDPGSPLLELVNLTNIRIDFAAPQEVFAQLTTDTAIDIQPAGHPEPVVGKITRIVPVTDPQDRSFIIHAQPQGDIAMTPGMSAKGLLRLSTGDDAVVIPRDALIRSPTGRTTAWVVDRSGEAPVARERKVSVRATFGDRVALSEGLDAGTEVVVRGNSRLQDGQQVRIDE